ncbi:MAG: rhodanese-like domain-containing protein [Alphaproteobacteria bacterium]
MNDGYSGDLNPQQAWDFMKENPDAVLVDVRTPAEFHYIGIPRLDALGKTPILIPLINEQHTQNPNFIENLKDDVRDANTPILFLCRSGGRSRQAAMMAHLQGFSTCYNIAEGFEGDLDANHHRGTINGWKQRELPWKQT